MKRSNLLTRLATAMVLGTGAAQAQTAPAGPVQINATPTAPDPIMLSPFLVDTTADRGYQAEHTLSGSRLNSRLRDTPASVSVFTPEFTQDVGLSELAEIVNYSVNAQVDLNDTSSSVTANPYVSGASLVKLIDIRGIPASQGLDYFKSIRPTIRIGLRVTTKVAARTASSSASATVAGCSARRRAWRKRTATAAACATALAPTIATAPRST